MKNVMVDLETFGNNPKSVIVSIGAVKFDVTGVGETFYVTVDPASCVECGMLMDTSTVLWWMEQSEQARKAICAKEGKVSIPEALQKFSKFFEGSQTFWGNGASFDNVILRSAYDLNGLEAPWKFWNDRCYRTMKAMYPNIKMIRKGTYHNALDDAISQAEHLMEIMTFANI